MVVVETATKPVRFADFWQGAESLAPGKTTSELSKVVRACCVFNILTWKCSSRRSGVLSTSELPKVLRGWVFSTFWLGNVVRARTACIFLTSQLPKVFRGCGVLYILTSKCASRHKGVHFFNISTSKSAPNPSLFLLTLLTSKCASHHTCVCFFDLWTSKGGARMVCFGHSDFQIWLPNVLRATTACNFSSLIWPCGSAPAALASLRSHKSLEKHSVLRLFYLFAHLHLLSSDSFSSLIFSLLLRSSLTLLISAFPSVHVVGSLTSELPWNII